TDPRFLAATHARVALVSVGADNPYGHPAAKTIADLTRDGMQVHRTDRQGDVAVVGSSRSWGVATRGASTNATAAGRGEIPAPAAGGERRRGRQERGRPVAACGSGRRTPRTDVPAEGGRRRRGTAPGPRGHGRPGSRARAPPRRGGPRDRRCRAAG